MTFVLKDFNAIKKHFNEAVTTILRREKIDSVGDLPKKRREEIMFLQSVLTELESRITHYKPKNLKPFAEVLSGAMLVIKKDIKDNLGYMEKAEGSLLYTSLDTVMGIDGKDFPDHHQTASYYYALNSFLALIYKEGNSRLGLSSAPVFASVPLEKLVTLATSSYQLEEAVRKEITKNYVADGKTDAKIGGYVTTKDTAASAVEPFTSYATLKASLDSLIIDERAKHSVPKISALPNKTRVTQLLSLQILSEALATPTAISKIKESERIAILAGTMLLVREQIGQNEYSKTPFSTDAIERSEVHKGLTGILKAQEIDTEDAQALITAAQHFTAHMTLDRTDNKGVVTEAIRAKHIFSDIPGFNLASVLDLMQKLIKTCRIDALNRCIKDHKKEVEGDKPKEASISYASLLTGGWFGGKKAVVTDDAERTVVLEQGEQKEHSPKAETTAKL